MREIAENRTYAIHPGVAQAGRTQAGAAFQNAVDEECSGFWVEVMRFALQGEEQEQGAMVVRAGLSGAPYLMRLQRWEAASALLERVGQRDKAPSTLAAILPLLRRIADATQGSPRGLIDAGVLAITLSDAGRIAEAEAMMRETIQAAVPLEQFQTASAVAGDLINLLAQTGRTNDALALIDKKKEYTQRAGLGPWTQLSDEGHRLQILEALGKYEEVLGRVEELRKTMRDLAPGEHEAVNPWNVRETMLGVGHSAAARLEKSEAALSLNRENLESKQNRGAQPLEIARAKFNNYGQLLELKRFPEVQQLLQECRSAFEDAGYTDGLQAVFSALASLEGRIGNTGQSVHHERTALRYTYVIGDPENCAISHFNLATYLMRTSAPPETALAHRLAAALIELQTSSGGLAMTLDALARHLTRLAPTPPLPRDFDHLCEIVEQVEGVRFRELFDRLPKENAATGDEALQRVLALVEEIRKKQNS